MSRTHCFVGFVAVSIAAALAGCEPRVSPAQATALSSALDGLQADTGALGVALAVRTGDGAQWMHARGIREETAALAVDDLARFGSVTKTVTAALVLQLVEEGKLSLDARISDFDIAVPNADGIRVRDLLTHRSGVFNYTDDQDYLASLDERPRPFSEAFEVASRGGALFPPGASFYYSNTNYVALGAIAERVTGRPFEVEVRERFFEPLGMDAAFLAGRERARGSLAHGYAATDDGWRDVTFAHDLSAQAPDGALVSSLEDALTWTRALYAGDVLDPSTRDAMVEASSRDEVAPIAEAYGFDSAGYGLGTIVLVDAELGPVWGHAGNIAGYGAFVGYVPSRDVAFAWYATRDGTDAFAAARIVVDALTAFPSTPR